MSEKTVFISYRRDSSGKAFARALKQELTHRGYDAFLDVDTIDAGKWADQILTQVAERSHFLILLTPDALTRCANADDWVRREFELAVRANRNIVPIREESVDLTKLNQVCPQPMQKLFGYQIAYVDYSSFERDVETLIDRFIPGHKAPGKPSGSVQDLMGERKVSSPSSSGPSYPSGWWWYLLGWIDYRRAKSFREEVFEDYRVRELTPLVPGFKTELQGLGREGVPQELTENILIINGPAGVGKSTYMDQLLRTVIGQGEADRQVDLFVRINGQDIAGVISKEDHLGLLQIVCSFFSSRAATTMKRPLTQAGVTYALRKKRVMLLIEDLHQAGSSMKTLKFLENYRSKYHRWGTHFIGTTREPTEKLSELKPAQIRSLHPIGQREAQVFFFKLCILNDLDQEKLVEHGEALNRAFEKESLQAPLFVVICASLASHPTSKRVDVGSVLRMNTRQLFDAFSRQLYDRSALPGKSEENYKGFRDTYEDLALALWPDKIFDEQTVAKTLGEVAPVESPFDAKFLESNGFLHLEESLQRLLTFPHDTMADYLAAAAMVRLRQFNKIRESAQYARVESLVPFLVELIKPSALELLAQAEPSAFTDVVTLHQASVARSETQAWLIPAVPVARAVGEWVVSRPSRLQPRETWERLRDLLDATRTTGWSEEFCKVIAQDAEPTSSHIEALAIVGRKPAKDLLIKGLKSKNGVEAFRNTIENVEVQEFLLGIIVSAGLGTDLGRRAFDVLTSAKEKTVRAELINRVGKNFERLEERDLQFLIKLGKGSQSVLGYACTEQSLRSKRQLAAQCVYLTRHSLVAPGVYLVKDENDEDIKVWVEKPILVPCRPENAGLQTSYGTRELIERKVGVKKLMTKELLLVLHQHFQHLLPDKFGALFAETSKGQYEALLDDGKVGLFYFYRDKAGRERLGSTNEHKSGRTQGAVTVLYRLIEEL